MAFYPKWLKSILAFTYLEKIRDNSRWGKIKNTLIQKGLPFTIDMVKSVADAFITAAAEGVTKGILNGGTPQP